MAYCRFGESDIYLYPSVDGSVTCCGCPLSPKVPSVWTKGGDLFGKPMEACPSCGGDGCDDCMIHSDADGMTYAEAIEHVEQHIAAGHSVPSGVIEALKRDQELEVKGADSYGGT